MTPTNRILIAGWKHELDEIQAIASSLKNVCAIVFDSNGQVFVPTENDDNIEFLDDNNIIFTDKAGQIFKYNGSEKSEVLGGPEIYLNRQGGLMDIQLHPDFKDNNTLYITYAKKLDENGGNTTIARAKLNGKSLVDLEDIFVSKQSSEKGTHWGSRIAFDKEGHLYFGIGDRGSRDINPQDLYRDGGKVFRINDDGSIPSDNPYVDKIGINPAIYSYGHRNPQGIFYHP